MTQHDEHEIEQETAEIDNQPAAQRKKPGRAAIIGLSLALGLAAIGGGIWMLQGSKATPEIPQQETATGMGTPSTEVPSGEPNINEPSVPEGTQTTTAEGDVQRYQDAQGTLEPASAEAPMPTGTKEAIAKKPTSGKTPAIAPATGANSKPSQAEAAAMGKDPFRTLITSDGRKPAPTTPNVADTTPSTLRPPTGQEVVTTMPPTTSRPTTPAAPITPIVIKTSPPSLPSSAELARQRAAQEAARTEAARAEAARAEAQKKATSAIRISPPVVVSKTSPVTPPQVGLPPVQTAPSQQPAIIVSPATGANNAPAGNVTLTPAAPVAPPPLSAKERAKAELQGWVASHQLSYVGSAEGPSGRVANLRTSSGEATVAVGENIPGTRIVVSSADDSKAVLRMDGVNTTLTLGGTQ